MRTKPSVLAWVTLLLTGVATTPVFAQPEPAATATWGIDAVVASIITAGFALGIAAGLGAIGQGRAIGSAAEAIARNPSASGEIRGVLILGLVLIESLVIYVLLISLILFFINPFQPGG